MKKKTEKVKTGQEANVLPMHQSTPELPGLKVGTSSEIFLRIPQSNCNLGLKGEDTSFVIKKESPVSYVKLDVVLGSGLERLLIRYAENNMDLTMLDGLLIEWAIVDILTRSVK